MSAVMTINEAYDLIVEEALQQYLAYPTPSLREALTLILRPTRLGELDLKPQAPLSKRDASLLRVWSGAGVGWLVDRAGGDI